MPSIQCDSTRIKNELSWVVRINYIISHLLHSMTHIDAYLFLHLSQNFNWKRKFRWHTNGIGHCRDQPSNNQTIKYAKEKYVCLLYAMHALPIDQTTSGAVISIHCKIVSVFSFYYCHCHRHRHRDRHRHHHISSVWAEYQYMTC